MKNRPILTPPVQKGHIAYYITRFLVSQAARRFHRLTNKSGFYNLINSDDPVILVSNHQNGMMDGLNISGVMSKQFSWLTRADVFWKPIPRSILFSFNQMPIYRQRDKLIDLRERNEIIWNCCIDRLELGAALAIFPEGNHNPQKTIRGLKRGLSDLLGKALTKHKSLKRLRVIPLGLDYEDYPGYRRKLSLRVGEQIEWLDLYNEETGLVDFKELSMRVQEALRNLTVDIQPAGEYEVLEPYVKALKTYDAEEIKWNEIKSDLKRIKKSAENEEWLERVKRAYAGLQAAGFNQWTRTESWGVRPGDVIGKKYWAIALSPLSWIANMPTALQQFILNRKGDKIKAREFRSTFKIGTGMFIYPITWTLMAIAVGITLSKLDITSFWIGFVGMWSWATFGNRFYGWLSGHIHDHNDSVEGSEFWGDGKMNTLRMAWGEYIKSIKS